ncbi:MAG: sulfite exporter TauE/SafE family protein [Betaproteobacteria bacterium]
MTPILAFAGISLAVVITSFISGILGMAGGMILMGILLALMPVPAAMMLHGITQMAANGWRAWLWRSEIDWRVLRGTAYGALGVLAVFSALQLVGSRPVVYLILGITPFIGFMLPQSWKLNVDKRGHAFACGVVCTALSLLSGVSGPLLDVFFLQSKMDRRGVVATKAASQTFAHLVKIVYFGALLVSAPAGVEWWTALTMVVLAVAGTTLSRKVLDAMTDKNFRLWTRWTVAVIGAVYLCNGIWMFAGR